MTGAGVSELDFPSGQRKRVQPPYDGLGVRFFFNIGPFWKRLLFAKHLGDWKMLFNNQFTSDTKGAISAQHYR